MKLSGMPESAERIERVLEVVRRELGKSSQETDWQSLVNHWAQGVEETEAFAVALGASEGDDALIHVFLLRQLEVSMRFIAKLSEHLMLMQNQMGDLRQEAEAREVPA